MFWDCLIITGTAILCVNGWHRGLLRSWSGIVAIVCATLLTRYCYPSFAAWLSIRLLLNAIQSSLVAYLLTWIAISSLIEMVLGQVVPSSYLLGPTRVLDRWAGACYGLLKVMLVVMLCLMVVYAPAKVPPPPTGTLEYGIPDFMKQSSRLIVPLVGPLAQSLGKLDSVHEFVLGQ